MSRCLAIRSSVFPNNGSTAPHAQPLSRCLICHRRPHTDHANMIVRRLINELPSACEYCKQIVSRSDRDEHNATCEERQIVWRAILRLHGLSQRPVEARNRNAPATTAEELRPLVRRRRATAPGGPPKRKGLELLQEDSQAMFADDCYVGNSGKWIQLLLK